MEIISSRTPEGQPNACPVCGALVKIEPSKPSGEATCPHCGHLLWFDSSPVTIIRIHDTGELEPPSPLWDRVLELVAPTICLDLSRFQGRSSAIVGKLILLRNRIEEANGRLTLVNVDPGIRDILLVMKLDFRVREDDSDPSDTD